MPADLSISSHHPAPEGGHLSRPGELPHGVLTHLGAQLKLAIEQPQAEALPARLADLIGQLEKALASRAAARAQTMGKDLIAAIPALRSFAFSLTYNLDRADDLVQDTLVRAWAKAETFTPGTHLIAWLFTILRNLFYSEQRKKKREVEDADGKMAERQLITLPDQEIRVEFTDLRSALGTLPAAQREALILIGAQGLSYEETAGICGVAVGTIKSRVNRARTSLVHRLGMDETAEIGTDALTRAASSGAATHGLG